MICIIAWYVYIAWMYHCFKCCVSFCCTTKWINCTYTHIPSFLSLLLHPSSHPSRSSQGTELNSLCYIASSHYCCSVAKSCLTLCDPMNCSTPSFPVLHCLPELAQTHVHWVCDAIHHLILCHPLLLPSIFPSIRVFSNESALHIRWPKYWSFSISASSSYSGLISVGLTSLTFLLSKGVSRVFSSTTIKFFFAQPSLWSNSHIHTWLLEKNMALTI